MSSGRRPHAVQRRCRPAAPDGNARSPRHPLVRALSKLGIASRSNARALVAAGHVTVNGRIVTDPLRLVSLELDHLAIDGRPHVKPARRLLALHKPRGTVTTRRDPEGRRTVFDVMGAEADGFVAVGRLDLASTGLLLLTTDTALAAALTDPVNDIVRRYVVTVRGEVTIETASRLERGIPVEGERGRIDALRAARVTIRKASRRETHLIVELTEGKNREIRRLFASAGHEVTRLHRVSFGPIELGALKPGEWRAVADAELPILTPRR